MKRVNPLRTLRESAGFSLSQLEDHCGITQQAIIRAEQGVYASPPPNLLDALWEYAPEDDLHDYGILMADYHNYQRLTRQDNYGQLDPDFKFASVGDHHPFVEWRIISGIDARIQISKRYCVHPATVFKFEAQPYMCSTVPNELIAALRESGYDSKVLDDLKVAFEKYRQLKKSKKAVEDDKDE